MKTLMLFFWIITPLLASAQNSLQGSVFDQEDLTPLPGSHIIIEGTHIGAFAGSNGQFTISNLKPGAYVLEVSFIGYMPLRANVTVPAAEPFQFLLQRKATMTGEVVVTANRATGRIGATYTDVTRDELMPYNLGQDLPVLIGLTPSVIVSSDAGAGVGYTSMNIRGSDQSRINVTLNGIPLNNSESHGVWWVNMPDLVSAVDNLQIQRGVGLSTHGAGAFGATISMQSNTLRDQTYAELSSSAGSFNTFKNSLGFGTGILNNNWAFDGRISQISSGGYIERASSKLNSFFLSGGYYGKNTMIKGVAFSGKETTYQAWNGVPGDSLSTNRRFNPSGMYVDNQGQPQFYENETDNYQQDHYQLHLSHMFVPALTANLSLHYTYGRGYYEQYRQNERLSRYSLPAIVIGNQTIDRSDLIRRRWLDNHFYGFTYSMNYNTYNKTSANLGGAFNIYDGDHFGEIIWARSAPHTNIRHRYYDNNGYKKDFNTFFKINQEPVDRLHTFVDLQYRFVSYDFLGMAWVSEEIVPLEQQVTFHFLNPKAGISYELSAAQQLYAYFGVANREPVRRDFTESSPESRPKHETMQNLELGYKFSASRLKFASNFFLMNYKDQLILTGEINDTGGFTRTNIDKSYRLGLELEAAFIVNKYVQWNGNLSLSRNKIPSFTEYSDAYDANWKWTGMKATVYENTDIAFSPAVIASSMLRMNPGAGFGLDFNTKYVGKRYIDNSMNPDRMLRPYLVNNLKISYQPKSLMFKKLELALLVNNLFNVMYETNAWIYKAYTGDNGLATLEDGYFPQAGRHFLAGISIGF